MKTPKIKKSDTGVKSDRSVYICRGKLILNDMGLLTVKERAKMCTRLRQLADDLRINGKNYAHKYTARYLV